MHIDLELYRQDVRTRDGVRLSVIDVQPERPQRTLVFIHGFGGWAKQWCKQLQFFADASRCIAPDLRGHACWTSPACLARWVSQGASSRSPVMTALTSRPGGS